MRETIERSEMSKLSTAEREMYTEFMIEFRRCFACRYQPLPSIESGYPWVLENCHIVGNSGRTHDRRNLVRLCKLHHLISHGSTFAECLNAKLTLENMLWLKQTFDEKYYDLEYLKSLRIKRHEPIEPMPLEPIGA